MTSQERVIRCFHYQPYDHVPDTEMGYWDENHLLWQKEGLPPGLDTNEKLNLFFGLEERHTVPIVCRVLPSFNIEEVEVRDGYR